MKNLLVFALLLCVAHVAFAAEKPEITGEFNHGIRLAAAIDSPVTALRK